jgi:hypothetical protein
MVVIVHLQAKSYGVSWRMPSSGILHGVALVRTDVLEESIASIIRVTRIGEGGTSAVTSNQSTRLLQEPHGVTSQDSAFFIVTTVKTLNITWSLFFSYICYKMRDGYGVSLLYFDSLLYSLLYCTEYYITLCLDCTDDCWNWSILSYRNQWIYNYYPSISLRRLRNPMQEVCLLNGKPERI